MKRDVGLSSEQALDDYFNALLDDSEEELELVQEIEVEPVPDVSQADEVIPQLQRAELPLVEKVVEVEDDAYAPNLDDIQRLLDRLESSDPFDELGDVEALIEENTRNLHSVEVAEVDSAPEEIQEWDITVDEPEPVTEVEVVTEVDIDIERKEPVTEIDSELKEQEVDSTPEPEVRVDITTDDQADVQSASDTEGASAKAWQSTERGDAFQVLYFDVCGVMFAVPLDALGGIHKLQETNHLIGRPGWYLGLQTNRDTQLDVVDTAKWVMPDKLADEEYKSTYQYIVMLGESLWGLACGELKGTELVRPDQVRWREVAGKRPWLAGMVKEKMCALIHVEALIQMLQSGLDAKTVSNH